MTIDPTIFLLALIFAFIAGFAAGHLTDETNQRLDFHE